MDENENVKNNADGATGGKNAAGANAANAANASGVPGGSAGSGSGGQDQGARKKHGRRRGRGGERDRTPAEQTGADRNADGNVQPGRGGDKTGRQDHGGNNARQGRGGKNAQGDRGGRDQQGGRPGRQDRGDRQGQTEKQGQPNRQGQADKQGQADRPGAPVQSGQAGQPGQAGQGGQKKKKRRGRRGGDSAGSEVRERPAGAQAPAQDAGTAPAADFDAAGIQARDPYGIAADPFFADSAEEERIIDSMPPDPTLDAVFSGETPAPPEEPADGVPVVGVRFPQGGKVYWFDPAAVTFAAGDPVIVETARGTELGFVSIANRKVSASGIVQPLKPVIRKASEADIAHDADNRRRADAAIKICRAKVEKHGLDMKLVGAQYTFDNSKLIFYFTAAQRVDFRELVKDLAAEFRTRIELRQIGIRDEAKMLGGYGVCGRRLCCSYFLPNFAQVSVRMAKEQGLSLNSSKISGNCGRLMCCLRFEQSTYEKELAAMPAPGSVVNTPDGRGTVTETRPVGEMLKVRLDEKTDQPPKVYSLSDVTVISRAEFRNEGPDDDADLPEQ